MLDMDLNQWMIAGTGLLAIAMLTFGNPFWRGMAPIFGLAGQPFWFLSALASGQLGVLAVTLAYTVVWMLALMRSLSVARVALEHTESDYITSDLPESDCEYQWDAGPPR